ncbi:hypothetical protein ElyMa_005850000 [Elysia marginata]|uniref:Uncharacterized protein n=1 Tax=Elysia marginata TaxID=1093978 RepID=A0AAV4FYW5_9GAST|nr:hypothetical protein ElyMa_005850000 [Elysia marginata]
MRDDPWRCDIQGGVRTVMDGGSESCPERSPSGRASLSTLSMVTALTRRLNPQTPPQSKRLTLLLPFLDSQPGLTDLWEVEIRERSESVGGASSVTIQESSESLNTRPGRWSSDFPELVLFTECLISQVDGAT